MEPQLFLRGLVIGFSIAAPVGPIGVLCIRRTLARGRWMGFVSGLGAASADAVYGSLAALGLTAISSALINQQDWLRLIGGAFLLYLGIKTGLARPAPASAITQVSQPATRPRWGLLEAYGSTFFLTLTNPVTILSFAAIFAGLGITTVRQSSTAGMLLVSGVFVGSALWWLLLSSAAGVFWKRLTGGKGTAQPGGERRELAWVNRLSGLVIAGFGLAVLGSILL